MRVYIWGEIIFNLAIENTIVIYDHESVSLRKNDLWFGYWEHHSDVWSWECKFEEEWCLI